MYLNKGCVLNSSSAQRDRKKVRMTSLPVKVLIRGSKVAVKSFRDIFDSSSG